MPPESKSDIRQGGTVSTSAERPAGSPADLAESESIERQESQDARRFRPTPDRGRHSSDPSQPSS